MRLVFISDAFNVLDVKCCIDNLTVPNINTAIDI